MSYKDVTAIQDPLAGRTLGMVTVEVGGRNAIEFGPDYSRHANEGENSTLEFQANGEYLLGDHAIGFGYAFSETDIYNLFVQNALGSGNSTVLKTLPIVKLARSTTQVV